MGANDFEDVPAGFRLNIPLTYQDRVDAICYDQHHCTIANGIVRLGWKLGITALGHRGASKTMVQFYADPRVFKWAKPRQLYRARLSDRSAYIVDELDGYLNRDAEHAAYKRGLRRAAKKLPEGMDAIWDQVTILDLPPSLAKDYRKGFVGKNPGPRSPVSGAANRRYNGYPLPVAPPPKRKVKATTS
jgi:hypothetical protein